MLASVFLSNPSVFLDRCLSAHSHHILLAVDNMNEVNANSHAECLNK